MRHSLVLTLALIVVGPVASAEDVTSQLAREPYWLLLGLYEKTIFGGYQSAVVDPRFFLAPHGAMDPLAELTATLRAMDQKNSDLICAHPARVKWLASRLSINLGGDLLADCVPLRRWKQKLDVSGLSLVMPATSVESTLGAFSHTFLKFQSHHFADQSTLNTAVGFRAAFNPDTPLVELAAKGVFGGYLGRFGVHGYYDEIEQYGYAESREIFEYPLSLTIDEIDQLLNLIWEIQSYEIRYYFFTRNCSYYILSLLDAARPSLHLSERFHGLVIPQETLLEIYWNTGLVSGLHFVPSRETKFRGMRESLNDSERVAYQKLSARPAGFAETWKTESAAFDSHAKARVLDTFSLYLIKTDRPLTDDIREQVFVARAELGVPPSQTEFQPVDTPPHLGHGAFAAGVGAGVEDDESYEMIRFRPVLHDFLNRPDGHNKDAQIEALDIELMFKGNEVEVHQFKLLEVFSLHPLETDVKMASWRIQSEVQRLRIGANYREVFMNDFGWGLSLGDRAVTGFGLLTLNSALQSALQDGYQAGPGALLGVRIEFSASTHFLAELWPKAFVIGQVESMLDADAGLGYALGRNWEVRTTANVLHRIADYQISFLHFF